MKIYLAMNLSSFEVVFATTSGQKFTELAEEYCKKFPNVNLTIKIINLIE